jgi:uncharacterized protein (DUF2147 family)
MRIALIAASAVLTAAGSAAAQGADPTGTWLTASGDTKVRIARCGAAYCGTIVESTHRTDVNNPDPAMRARPVVGLRLTSDMLPSGDGYSGTLYNPQDGRTYSGRLRIVGPASLELSGCVLGGLICRSQTWKRTN